MPDYKVTVDGHGPIMVRASNQAQARNFAVRKKVKVEPLTTEDAIKLSRDGQDLLDASDEDADPALPEAPPPAPDEQEEGGKGK